VVIGATEPEGGSRGYVVEAGGAETLPFYTFEGLNPRPVLALEVYDCVEPLPSFLLESYRDVVSNPVEWARLVDRLEPDLVNLNVRSISPTVLDRSPRDALKTVEAVLQATRRPLMVTGIMDPIHRDDTARNMEFLRLVAETFKGERLLIGPVTPEAFETVAEAALANGHNVLAKTNMDVNQAIRLNELLVEKGLTLERIVVDVTTGALGYGVEYTLSTMERFRIRGLKGDRMARSPLIFFASENLFIRELENGESGMASIYEASSAVAGLMAGADIVSMLHPESLEKVRRFIDEFPWRGG